MASSIPDMAIEEYLDLVESGRQNRMEQSLITPSESPEGMISADTVKNIMGGLTNQMEVLNKKLNEAKVNAGINPLAEGQTNNFTKKENTAEMVQVTSTEQIGNLENDFLLPFENQLMTSSTNVSTTPLMSSIMYADHAVTTTTTTGMIFTQTPTTPVTVSHSIPFQSFLPPVTVNHRNDMFTASQFDIIQQQMSLLTQTVSLLTILINNSQKPKILEPKVYSYEKEQDLHKFLDYFEKYCNKKYPQSPDQWLRLLEKYLTGKFLRLYNVIVKTVTDYSTAKGILIKWYIQEEKKRNENKLRAYHSAKRETGEDINLFAMRLEQLAEQAFPGVNMREHESLRTAFILSLPTNVQTKLREFIIQNEMCTQTKVPWDKLVLLADSYDREFQPWKNVDHLETQAVSKEKSQRRDIEVVQVDAVTPQATWSEILKRSPPPPNRQYQKTPSWNLNHNRDRFNQESKSVNFCTHCGRNGHTINECYKALGICSYCKTKGHIRNDCWHSGKNGSSLGGNNKSVLECPYCKGDHLGINCNSRSKQSPPKQRGIGNKNQTSCSYSPPRPKTNFSLPQRTQTNNSRTYENSSLTIDPWAASGAKPKTRRIDNCQMCGESHNEGECLGDHPENCPTPQ